MQWEAWAKRRHIRSQTTAFKGDGAAAAGAGTASPEGLVGDAAVPTLLWPCSPLFMLYSITIIAAIGIVSVFPP